MKHFLSLNNLECPTRFGLSVPFKLINVEMQTLHNLHFVNTANT